MKKHSGIGLAAVQAVYAGPERRLWELVMGEQIHIGGLASSQDLARRAGIRPGWKGIDLCCCTGAGMRFLVRFARSAGMIGVDATEEMVRLGRTRVEQEGLQERIEFIQADVCDVPLPEGQADFVWGEDAWCYVGDKPGLVAEAVRLVRPGGTIAFTDWIEGPAGMSDSQAERMLAFMKFPSIAGREDYTSFLAGHGCSVIEAEYTGRFAIHADLYIRMLEMQLTYDALKIIGFDAELMSRLAGELGFLRDLAREGGIEQGLFVARKKG